MNKNSTPINRVDRFSPSSILDYMSCPKLFYYRYVAKIKLPQKQIHLIFGSAVHAGIEGMFNGIDPYAEFDRTFLKEKLLPEEYGIFAEYQVLGKDMLKNYLDRHETLNNLYGLDRGESELYAREYIVNPLSNEKSSLPMSMKIDRLADMIEGVPQRIVEYKTSKAKWAPDAANLKIQTKLYCLWYYTKYGVLPPKETVYIILLKKFNKFDKSQKIQVLTTNYTKQDLAQTFEQVELIIEKINNNEFGYPQGYHAHWCDCRRYEEVLGFTKKYEKKS